MAEREGDVGASSCRARGVGHCTLHAPLRTVCCTHVSPCTLRVPDDAARDVGPIETLPYVAWRCSFARRRRVSLCGPRRVALRTRARDTVGRIFFCVVVSVLNL